MRPSPVDTDACDASDGVLVDSLQMHLSEVRLLDGRHADRPVFRASWVDPSTGERSPVVVKRFEGAESSDRASAAHRLASAVWWSSAGVGRTIPVAPRPVAVGSWGRSGAAVVMEALDGAALGARGDLGRSVERSADAAALFADLHAALPVGERGRHRWSQVPRRPAARVLRSTGRKLDELPAEIAAHAGHLVEVMHDAAAHIAHRGEHLVLTHGDAAPRNVLATSHGLRLIDLDRVHLAGAGRDVAYWIAWAHATAWTGLADQRPTWDLVRHYRRHRTAGHPVATPAPPLDLAFHLAAAFVRIVHGWSALRHEPAAQRRVLSLAGPVVDGAAAVDDRCRRAEGWCGENGDENMRPCEHDDGPGRTR